MTTPPYGETDPFATGSDLPSSSSPIGDELAHDAGITPVTTTPPPAPPTTTSAPTSSESDSSGGAAESAKETAQEALGSATEHASSVADTAKEEATKVAAEAKDKATDLLADVKTQVDEQSKAQLQGLAAKLGELADEIVSMVNGEGGSGPVSGAAQQLADKTHQLSSHLESREPMDLLDDVRGFASRRPAAFLAGAAVAGLLAGRLTRGAKAAQAAGGPDTSSPTTTTTATPAPTYAAPTGAPFSAPDVPGGQNTGGRQ